MVMYVVKDIMYGNFDCVDVRGIYSNLALAGRAVMQTLKEYSTDNDTISFTCRVEPWGYYFKILTRMGGETWTCGEMEITRIVVNE